MSNKPNAARIGLFIIVGFTIFLGIVGKFTWDKLFPNNDNLVLLFFEESVKGLSVGAPVVLEGVEVGKVVRIELVADPKTLHFNIPVYVRFSQAYGIGSEYFETDEQKKELLKELVAQGMRARLATQNFLTGQLMIELVMLPDAPISYKQKKKKNARLEIPTVLSAFGELSKGMQDLPLREVIEKLNRTMDSLDENIPVILPKISELGDSLNRVAISINRAMPETTGTILHINKTLDDISEAAKSFRNLTDYIERHPESLLKGKKGN